jgi:hypothetical protein
MTILCEQWRDEHKKDVVEKQQAEQNDTYLEVWQSDNLHHLNTEHYAKKVLQHPRISLVPNEKPQNANTKRHEQQQNVNECRSLL